MHLPPVFGPAQTDVTSRHHTQVMHARRISSELPSSHWTRWGGGVVYLRYHESS
jgi:hypothetical protein